MKKRLLCLLVLLVSVFALSQVSFTTSPPAPNPNDVKIFKGGDHFWRPNTYVDIQYADDLYLYAIDTNLDNKIVVNVTETLFNLTAMSSSSGTATFSASGLDAQYSFTWSPSSQPYVKNVEGTVTSFDISNFVDGEDIDSLTFEVVASGTSVTKVFCAGKGEPTTLYGVTLTDYDETSEIATLTASHSSSVTGIIEWGETPGGSEPPIDEGGAETKYVLKVTVVDQSGLAVHNAIVTVWKGETKVDSELTDEDGLAEFVLSKASYLITAEGSPRVGTASVKLDTSLSVTITLREPSMPNPLDILEGIGETLIEPVQQFFQSFLSILVGFAFFPIAVAVSWYGVSEEENWMKIIGLLIALLGITVLIYAFAFV